MHVEGLCRQVTFSDFFSISVVFSLISWGDFLQFALVKSLKICEIYPADHFKPNKMGVTRQFPRYFAVMCFIYLSQFFLHKYV